MTSKAQELEATTDHPTVYDRVRRRHLSCSYCPPQRGENKTRGSKRGRAKPRRRRRPSP